MEPMKPMAPMKPMEPMRPMEPMTFDPPWWPEDLGQPSSSGAQGDMRYAFFPEKRRLLIERGDRRTTYDTGTHRIGGVSQQSSHDRSPAFTSQHGPVRLEDLEVVRDPEAAPPTPGGQGEPQRAEQQRHDSHRGEAVGQASGQASSQAFGEGSGKEASPAQPKVRSQGHDLASPKGGAPAGERVVFTEEGGLSSTLKLIVSGDIDADMLEALEDFIKRQKRRLAKG